MKRPELVLMELCVAALFIAALFQATSPELTGMVTSATSRVLIIRQDNVSCNISLVSGWNLASTSCEPANASTAAVLESINTTLISAHGYEPSGGLDRWKAYNPSLPNWTVQDLVNITRTKGYWLNLAQNSSLVHNGTWFSPSFVPLTTPWTLAGYPTNVSRDISVSLQDIVGSVQAVYLYNASDTADPWKVYYPAAPGLSDLNDTIPGFGLWFRVQGNSSWMVIW